MYTARTDTPLHTPMLSIIFGYGPVLVILVCGLLALSGLELALVAGTVWSAGILMFLGGVTRGLSFFTQGGVRASQMAMMMLRFSCGLLALVVPAPFSFALLALGYLSIFLYDPFAANTGAAPRFFAHLRRPQMAVALVGLALLAAASLR